MTLSIGEAKAEVSGVPAALQADFRGEYGDEDRDASIQSNSISLQIPDEKWNKVEKDLILFIDQELNQAESERGDFMLNLARWKVAYAAPMPDKPKNFPIANASNLTVPVIKEIINTICAQLVIATLTNRPYWVVQDLAAEWEKFVDELQEFLDLSGDRELELDSTAVTWILETAKLGTGVMEIGYEVEKELRFKYKEDGSGYVEDLETVKDGPISYHIPLQKWWIRFKEGDIQKARWVGKELELTWAQLKEKENQGKFFNIDRLWQQEDPNTDKVTEVEEEIQNTEPLSHDMFRIFEIWCKWPMRSTISGRMHYTEIRFFYERKTRTILSKTFNPYWHGKRPFVKIGYMPVEHRFYDMGLCEMLEQLQVMISNKHNQRSDNATIANLKMFLKRKLVRGLKPGDPLYTGKIIEVNDVWNDVREFQAGEIYPSTINEESILRDYAERLSGVNDAVLGSAMPVTRTTAAAQLALLQEQTKRIDLTVRSIRKGMGKIGYLQAQLYFQFGSNRKGVAWMGKRGLVIDALFSLPRRISEIGLAIKVIAPTSTQNKQVKRENSLAMFNLLVQLYEKLLPLIGQLKPDVLPEVVHEMVKSAQRFMGDVLETFEVSDVEEVLSGLSFLERVLPKPEDLGGLEAFEEREGQSKILREFSRLEGLLREATGPEDRSTRLPPERNGASRRAVPERVSGGSPSSIPLGGDFIIQ